MVKLGDQVKDRLTGFKGTAVARAEYLYGCVWVCVVPEELHDGKPVDDVWFDEERLISEDDEDGCYIADKDLYTPGSKRRGGPVPSMPKSKLPKPNRG